MRPLLLLDVDGVLSPTGSAVPRGFERRATSTYSVVVRPDHRDWLQTLSDRFELIWASTWGEAANRVYGEIHGLEPFPVVPLNDLPRAGTRKLAAQAWARARSAPTLLVRTRASVGLTRDDVDRLLAFASRDVA